MKKNNSTFKPHPIYKKELKIISAKPCKLGYVFHGSGKKLKFLDPSFNSQIGKGGHELGVPIVYASSKPSDAFCYTPIKAYRNQRRKSGKSVYYRLLSGKRKILLGAKFGGYIYVCKGSDFYEIIRMDFENGKWIRSTEWVSYKKVEPIETVKISKPFEWECIPTYEFIGYDKVGNLNVKEYLKYAKKTEVIEKIKSKLKEKFIPKMPKELKKYIKK